MTPFSLGTVWEETIAFMRREFGLLLPVGFATFGVAQLILDIGMGDRNVPAAHLGDSPVNLLFIPVLLIMLVGNIAVSRMVLMPGGSVAESLMAALRALPKALVVILVIFTIMIGVALIVIVAATVGAMAFQTDPRTITPSIVTLLFVPMIFLAARLMMLIPILAVEQLGAIPSLRRAWGMSRAHFLRFFGVMMIVLLVTTLLGLVQLFVIGSLFKLLALAIGDSELVTIVQAVVSAGIASILSVAVTLYVALIYRHLVSGQP